MIFDGQALRELGKMTKDAAQARRLPLVVEVGPLILWQSAILKRLDIDGLTKLQNRS